MYSVRNLLSWVIVIAGGYIIHKHVKKKALGVVILLLILIASDVVYSKIDSSTFFNTPEEAAQYLSAGRVAVTIEGQDSCCILTTEDETTYVTRLLGKVNNRYRILGRSEWTLDTTVADDGMPVSLYFVDGTTDHYAVGTFFEPADSKIQITDTNGTVFSSTIVSSEQLSDKTIFAYARVGPVGEDYQVMVTFSDGTDGAP